VVKKTQGALTIPKGIYAGGGIVRKKVLDDMPRSSSREKGGVPVTGVRIDG